MNIYLIGYMGSGKTTVGKRLAKALGYRFIDLDHYIETYELRSIEDIFQKEGESGFRGIEKKYLHLISSYEKVVIATGGGTPCFYDNMNFMNERGTTVYLKMDVKSLHYRLSNAKGVRPLIKGLNTDELLLHITQQLEQRKEYYESAALTVNAFGLDGKKIDILAKQLTHS